MTTSKSLQRPTLTISVFLAAGYRKVSCLQLQFSELNYRNDLLKGIMLAQAITCNNAQVYNEEEHRAYHACAFDNQPFLGNYHFAFMMLITSRSIVSSSAIIFITQDR